MAGEACCFFRDNTSVPNNADRLIDEEREALLAPPDERCDIAARFKSLAWLCCASTFAAGAVAGMVYIVLLYDGGSSASSLTSSVSDSISGELSSYIPQPLSY